MNLENKLKMKNVSLPFQNWKTDTFEITPTPLKTPASARRRRLSGLKISSRVRSLARFSWILLLGLSGLSESVTARDFRVNLIPNGNRFSCANCHVSQFGGGARNPFGQAVEAIVGTGSGQFWSPTLAALDSDGDGFSNGRELGDPDGDRVPTAGAQVTNPGNSSSKPANTAPTVQITRPSNGTTFTPPANVEVEATASDSDGTIAAVEFLSNGTVVSTDTSAPFIYSVPASSLAPGNYSITARASDNLGASASSGAVQITVAAPANVPPTVQIVDPAGAVTVTQPAMVHIMANASDTDGTIARVEFVMGRSVVATVTSTPYMFMLNTADLAPGVHTLTARAVDNQGATTTSSAVEITVNAPANTPPVVQITQPAGGTTIGANASLELVATATDADGTIAKVEFLNEEAILATVTNAPFSHTIAAGTLTPGQHIFTVRATDNAGATTTSAPINITVSTPSNTPPIVQITQPAGSITVDTAASIEIIATVTDADGSIAKVEFLNGETVLTTLTNAPFSHTIAAGGLAAGQHTLTVRATDNGGAVVTSAPVQIIVTATEPTADPVRITALTKSDQGYTVTWAGGGGLFTVQYKNSLSDSAWINGPVTTNHQATVAVNGSSAIFRVADMSNHGSIPFSVSLSGAAERPNPVTTTAKGSGILRLEGNTLFFNVDYSGLSGAATAAHIHGPAPASEGAIVLIDLAPFNGGSFGTSGTLSGSVPLTPAQKIMILSGLTYINVHTSANGGGEIRGQVAPALFQTSMSGAAERPNPVATPGTGSGTFILAGDQLTFNIAYSGLTGPATSAHIHGPATQDTGATVMIDLAPFNGGAFGASGTLTGTVTLTPEQLAALVDGLTYVNVHTPTNGGGEIRGQILPSTTAIPMSVALSGAAERPTPVNTAATGSGLLRLEGNTLHMNLHYSGLSGAAIAAHIHGPASTEEGATVLIDLQHLNGGAFGTSGTLSGSVLLNAEQRQMVLSGRTYINIHTPANGGGEIRGQIAPVLLETSLNGANERPNPVTTQGTGTGNLLLVGDQLFFNVTYGSLSGPATSGHIHGPATVDEGATVMIDLAPFNGGVWGAAGSLVGSTKLTPAQLAAVLSGLTYVNVHTSANGGGEIRGQIVP